VLGVHNIGNNRERRIRNALISTNVGAVDLRHFKVGVNQRQATGNTVARPSDEDIFSTSGYILQPVKLVRIKANAANPRGRRRIASWLDSVLDCTRIRRLIGQPNKRNPASENTRTTTDDE